MNRVLSLNNNLSIRSHNIWNLKSEIKIYSFFLFLKAITSLNIYYYAFSYGNALWIYRSFIAISKATSRWIINQLNRRRVLLTLQPPTPAKRGAETTPCLTSKFHMLTRQGGLMQIQVGRRRAHAAFRPRRLRLINLQTAPLSVAGSYYIQLLLPGGGCQQVAPSAPAGRPVTVDPWR